MIRYSLLFFILLQVSLPALSQKKNQRFQLRMHKITTPIVIDGNERDAGWQSADLASNFYMVLPMDTSSAQLRTDVRMTYDDHNIYLLAVCFNGLPGPHMVESLRRDWEFLKNDNFLMFMDTFDDQTNGFAFGVNAAGAQWDGMMYEGGKVDLSWDNKWISEVRQYADRYVVEASIPFKSIRYKKGITTWGINFSRNDLKSTEKSAWAPVPRQFPTASLAYTGILEWDEPPPQAGTNVSIIPYVLGGASRDFATGMPASARTSAGGDAKISLTSSLNLDLTVHPDFSQVDVDKQVTNLSRFELFFPEKRQFFLENGDIFANYGYANIRPFFSRRIGLGVPIQFGARLSGRIDKNWRIGVMDMQTGPVESTHLPSQNFATAVIQRKMFSRSNISLLMMNKQSLNYTQPADPTIPAYSQYNRNVGLEYNLASSSNVWTGKMLYLKSFSPGTKTEDYVQAGHLQYFSRKWLILWQHEYTGRNYNAEVGYVPRHGYAKMAPQIARLFFPKGGKVLSHGPGIISTHYYNTSFKETDNETTASYLITFRSRSTLTAVAIHDYVKLLSPFDPTNSGLTTLATGTEHYWNSYGVDFQSKPQSVFTYLLSVRNGGYYAQGQRFNLTFEVRYRVQPYASLTINAAYNRLSLPQPWGLTNLWLISPRLDITMTNKLFFTTFLQYNQQRNNTNLNARFQWRYKPASDLFFVYTDNYIANNFVVKDRAFVVKWTYWWSL